MAGPLKRTFLRLPLGTAQLYVTGIYIPTNIVDKKAQYNKTRFIKQRQRMKTEENESKMLNVTHIHSDILYTDTGKR